MRVIRRSSLPEIMPLPDGLHFTPAMSARAILHPDLKIHEIDMPYKEREGESKLKVWKDGVRFLKVILEMTFLYQPQRVFFMTGLGMAFVAFLMMLMPTIFYIQHSSLEDWMNYRFMVANLLGDISLLMFLASFISERIVGITLSGSTHSRPLQILSSRFFVSQFSNWVAVLCFVAGVGFVANSLFDRITTGATNEHWSRYIVMSFFVGVSSIIWIAKGLNFILGLIEERLFYFRNTKK